jgi:hypothetical protein
MSYDEILKSVTLTADATLAGYTGAPGTAGAANPNTGKMYRFTKVTGSDRVGLAVSSADAVNGVLQNKPQVTGQAATVGVSGISNVVAGASITAGDEVTSDNEGRAIPVTLLGSAVNAATSNTFVKSSGTVTATTATHSLAIGDVVKIAGATTAGNNGTFVVRTVPSATTFTIANANGATEDVASGCTVQKVVRSGRVLGKALQTTTTVGAIVPVQLSL